MARWRMLGLVVASCASASACMYHNTIYNAEHLYAQAERSRREGSDSTAAYLYREVVAKTAEAYRARPESDWAPEALFLLGRSRLRLGQLPEAHAALVEAESIAPDELRTSVAAFRGAVLSERGQEREAIELLSGLTSEPLRPDALAEARLVLGRAYISSGRVERGWWELDRAVAANPDVRVEAGLERLRWAVAQDDVARARTALDLLLSYPEGGARRADVEALLARASEEWGAATTAGLLAAAPNASWARDPRGRLRLVRASLLVAEGDTAAGEDEAWSVAEGLGDAAAEARMWLARWELSRSEDIADAYAIRRILLPAGSHPTVVDLVEAVDELELYTDIGLSEPLGWFAAAEVARDRLGAEYLARGLFLAYADGAPDQPWAPKALLAALEVSPDETDRSWLRDRLEAHADSPYVLAAHGRSGAGFEALEEELQVRLQELRAR